MTIKNLIIISQYFYPSHASTSQLMTDLTNGLVDKNYDIKVYTGTPSNSQELSQLNITRSHNPFQFSKNILEKLVSRLFVVVRSFLNYRSPK